MSKTCAFCSSAIEGRNSRRKYCDSTCRARASEKGKRAQRNPGGAQPAEVLALPSEPTSDAAPGEVTAATLAELELAGRADCAAGRSALALARRIDAAEGETGAGLAALVRQHGATLAEAVKGAAKAADPLDELRARRERKHGAG